MLGLGLPDIPSQRARLAVNIGSIVGRGDDNEKETNDGKITL
jgi:hypothetical protein